MGIFILMAVIFVLGYLTIALEQPLKINKAPVAIFMGMILWIVYAIFNQRILSLGFSPSFDILKNVSGYVSEYIIPKVSKIQAKHVYEEVLNIAGSSTANANYIGFVKYSLGEHLNSLAQILFFLLGAMTIVETVDRYQGFKIITDKIKTTSPIKLIWILSLLTFFMSSMLDNLTTTIVMIALLRKLVEDKKMRWFFASMIVVAANAGGAWSPIGDVTTIMLWIGDNITTGKIILGVFIPALVSLVIPLSIVSLMLKGKSFSTSKNIINQEKAFTTPKERKAMFFLGIGGLLFVPILKEITNLPPYIGMLLSLSIVWITTEIIVRKKTFDDKRELSVVKILEHVDIPTIFFFLGILIAVAALESAGHLNLMAQWLNKATHTNYYFIATAIGIVSSIIDNVPLTASAIGMYHLAAAGHLATDGLFWELIAYTAGTGGSLLIIGSAAGVAAMGLEKIDFIWYAKKISWLVVLGYFSGIFVFFIQQSLFHILS